MSDEKILRTIAVAVTIKKTYKINIYEPEPGDKPLTLAQQCEYAEQVARERAKDEEEWGEQVRYGHFVIMDVDHDLSE